MLLSARYRGYAATLGVVAWCAPATAAPPGSAEEPTQPTVASESPPPRAAPQYPSHSWRARAEVEYVDVEGPGGFSNRDAERVAPRRRAGYVDLDKITLDLESDYRPWLKSRIEFRANADSARADRAYLTVIPWDDGVGKLEIEIGRSKPTQRPGSRRLETFSPQGAVFWRAREYHVSIRQRLMFGPVTFESIPSIAMQRSLGDESMGEDSGLPTIAFDHAEPDEDSQTEFGGALGAEAFGASVAAFAFRGQLLDNAGPVRLQQTYDDYALIGGDTDDRSNLWYGARAGFEGHGVYVFTEGIRQQLGLLKRRGFEVGASYTFAFAAGEEHLELEPMARYGNLALTNLPEDFETPQTWDREQVVLGLLLRPLREVQLKLEYLILDERAGVSAEGRTKVDDNQLLVHLRFTTGGKP